MRGTVIMAGGIRARLALGLVVLALLCRLLIPVGWMPAENGFFITLCNSAGATAVWMDEAGQVHKDKPAKAAESTHACAFAGMGVAFDLPGVATMLPPLLGIAALPVLFPPAVAIGRGLVAPPPPSTGPPATL